MPAGADPRYPRSFADVFGDRMAYVDVGDAWRSPLAGLANGRFDQLPATFVLRDSVHGRSAWHAQIRLDMVR